MRILTRVAVRRPHLVLAGWLLVVIALALVGRGLKEELQPASLIVPGTGSYDWYKVHEGRFGEDGTVLLRGPEAALDRQGRALALALTSKTRMPAISPWSGAKGAEALRPQPDLALIAVDLGERERSAENLETLQGLVADTIRAPVRAGIVGEALTAAELNEAVTSSAEHAELLSLPALILVLLLVFRSVVAAAVPLVIAAATVLSGTGVLTIIARMTEIDAVAMSLASMMGLALGVDYSLLIVARFREELGRGASARTAASVAANTAGRTAAFAGIVLIAIMTVALVTSPGSVLLSAATGSIVVTVIGMTSAVLVTPAMLALLGHRVEFGRLGRRRAEGNRLGTITSMATRRPLLATTIVGAILVAVSLPVLGIETSPPDPRSLPQGSPGGKALAEASRSGIGPSLEIAVRSDAGAITRPDRLTAIGDLERALRRVKLVRAVAGPGALAASSRQDRSAATADLPDIAGGRRQLAQLEDGLNDASAGVDELRSGLSAAQRGAEQLSDGTGQARGGAKHLDTGSAAAKTGARQLADGARQASSGAADLATALRAARTGARRLETGAGEAATAAATAAAGAASLADGLSKSLVPGLRELASRLREGKSGVSDLRTAAQRAESELRTAFAALGRMTVGRVDPAYNAALTAAGSALAAVSGRNPANGAPVQAGYDGLDRSLAAAARSLDDAADGAGRLATGAAKALTGARRLRDGARRLSRGLESLDDGAAKLRRGLDQITAGTAGAATDIQRLADGGDQLATGVDRLHGGTGALVTGLDELAAGQQQLDRGLRDASGRTKPLGGGLSGAADDVARLRGTLGTGSVGALADLQESSPGFFDSGYAGLAAIDGARPIDRAAATYLVAADHGGDTGRIIVTPNLPANDPRGPAFLSDVKDTVRELPTNVGLRATVGGSSAQLIDYDAETSSSLPLLILGTALVTYLLLIPILRSLVLPAIAVFLNLLTVAASFGVLTLCFVGDNPWLGGPGALDVIVVSAIFAITFALSIDYQVFLLVRMREAYVATQRNDAAIAFGVERTARTVSGAAMIMVVVFLAFASTNFASTRQFGVGLTAAVVIDATIVRLILLPALMKMFGLRTWWLPKSLDDRLRPLDIEGSDEATDPLILARRSADAW